MVKLRVMCDGELVVGVFSGVIRDGALLDFYERVLSDPQVKPKHDELYIFAQGSKLLVSFSRKFHQERFPSWF